VEFVLVLLMLFVASKEVRLEVNCEKTKYLLMPREKNSGQNHNISVANKSFLKCSIVQTFGTV